MSYRYPVQSNTIYLGWSVTGDGLMAYIVVVVSNNRKGEDKNYWLNDAKQSQYKTNNH